MSAISIPCPSCGSLLKVPDESFIGKRARCPRCSHRFVLTMPEDEVSLQLADDVPVLPAAPVVPPNLMVGTSARWVPDEIPSFPPVFQPNTGGSPPNPIATPTFSTPTVGMPPDQISSAPSFEPPNIASGPVAASPFDFGSLEVSSEPIASALGGSRSKASNAKKKVADPAPVANPEPAADAPTAGATSTGKSKAARRRRSNKAGIVAMLVMTLVVAMIGGFAFWKSRQPDVVVQTKEPPKVNQAWEKQKADNIASNASVEQLSPTSGKPIPLDYIPFTPHVLVHLRPAELWKGDNATREFQAMLGNLGLWLNDEIKRITTFDPQDISELTIAINFGPRMTPPEVAAVVRLREPQTETDLMKRWKGRLRPPPPTDMKVEVYESEQFCYLKVDRSTFTVASASLAEDLQLSANDAALASPDMDPLLKESDRDRHASILFDLKLIDSHREDIFIAPLLKISDQFVIWMGEEIETVSWSLHLQPHLFMETLLHQTTDSSALKVQRHAQLQLSRLAEDVLGTVRRMRPGTVGARQIIGRFPAMLQAINVGTSAHFTPEFARLVTILPQKAAANLAAGTLLTWNESLLLKPEEDLTKASDTSIPGKLVDRLKMKVLIDFRRTPLQEAFGYIADAIKTEATIDGKALQGAGFTQVMPQTFNLGSVTAQEGLYGIIKNYEKERDPLVLIVDEANKKMILSTKTKAAADGLTPFDLSPKP
jgi:hypothetical protein